MSDNKVSTRQGLAIGGGLFLGMGLGFMLIPILGGTAMVGWNYRRHGYRIVHRCIYER
jgi:hypothetical protein